MNDSKTDAGGLDAQELLHLALSAMENNRDADAIGLLKRGLVLDPEDGRLHYLLGAVHAQLGMVERALAELQRAVELAPEIEMAHFQLGLLHLTSGDVDAARETWVALGELGAEHPLSFFISGMLHLVADEFDACIADLQRGIAVNEEHESLNRDMAKVIDAAEQARTAAPKQLGEPAAAETTAADTQHVLLAGYKPRLPPQT